MMKEDALNIYTDGSSYQSPRRGGIGIRFITVDEHGAEVIDDREELGYKGATNNQMELFAAVLALRIALESYDLTRFNSIELFTDSQYVSGNYKTAMFGWSSNRWTNRNGRPVVNADRWKELIKLIKRCAPLRVNIHWVKGHSKNVHNKAVDKLAKNSAKGLLNRSLTIVEVRRKHTHKMVEIGSVEMKGQRLRIRVLTSEYLRPQGLVKYKYEVLSKRSKYFQNVDVIFSSIDLRAGHHYEVVVNKNTANPSIVRLLRELER